MSSQNNDIPEDFKMTELGLLPKEWVVVKLGDIVNFTSKPRGLDISSCTEVPFIPMEAISSDGSGHFRYNIKPGRDITSGVYCERGDLLLAKITPCLENGKQCLLSIDDLPNSFAYTTTEVYPLRADQNVIDSRLLFYYFLYPPARRELAAKMEGTTGRQRLPKHVVRNMILPLPPLPEQRAIVGVLSTIQEAIETQDKIIAAARELKKSLMRHLFTYGPVSVSEAEKVPLKETEIGPLPEHWEIKRISEVCQVKGSTISLPELIEQDTKDNTHAVVHGIKVSDMTLRGNEREISKANIEARLPEQLAKKVSVPANSVIFPKRGAAIATNKKRLTTTWTALDPNLIAVVPIKEVGSKYLFYWFLTIDISKLQSPGPTPQLNRKDVDPVLLPLPPQTEQQEIVRMVSAVDNKIESEENRKAALQTLFKTMLHLLMTGKVRVKEMEAQVS